LRIEEEGGRKGKGIMKTDVGRTGGERGGGKNLAKEVAKNN